MTGIEKTTAPPAGKTQQKRPRDDSEEPDTAAVADQSGDELQGASRKDESDAAKKKQERKQKLKEKQKAKRQKQNDKQIIETAAAPTDTGKKDGVDASIAQLDAAGLAALFAKQTKRYNKELTAVELSDLSIPGQWFHHDYVTITNGLQSCFTDEAFKDTSSWQETRHLDKLPAFLEQHTSRSLSTAPEQNGSPHTLVITLAGLRAAEITRLVIRVNGGIEMFPQASNSLTSFYLLGN